MSDPEYKPDFINRRRISYSSHLSLVHQIIGRFGRYAQNEDLPAYADKVLDTLRGRISRSMPGSIGCLSISGPVSVYPALKHSELLQPQLTRLYLAPVLANC